MYQIHKEYGKGFVPVTHHMHTLVAGQRQLDAYRRSGQQGLKLIRVRHSNLLDYYESNHNTRKAS